MAALECIPCSAGHS